MKIEVVDRLPARFVPDVLCRFHNLSGKRRKGKENENRSVTISGEGRTVVLDIDAGAFRFYEPVEARRTAGGITVKHVRKSGGRRLVWDLGGKVPLDWFRDLAEGALLALYRFEAYKGKKRKRGDDGKKLTVAAGESASSFRRELNRLRTIINGVSTARDLANTPANDLTPRDLVAFARRVARKYGLKMKVLSAAELKRKGYVGITAVGGGSSHPPALFELEYKPGRVRRGAKPLCLVGKGITFDSGGITLKPGNGMWDMKGDMSGAAAVIAALQTVAALKLPVEVRGVVATAENLPGGTAYRPGDILRYRNGRTVEIRSTDAEGRLILADALLYAQQVLRQRRIVEFSTLTGACMRALGQPYMGLMSRSRNLVREVKRASERSGEPVWELPLHPEYRAMIESQIADIKNTGGPFAGAQTAGWFLHEFIEEETEYVHLDIAGAFRTEKDDKYWSQPGATGVGVRLAVALAEEAAGLA